MRSMAQVRKYHISRSGSGWGIWDAEGKKVMGGCSHFHAVKCLYKLMGWEWNLPNIAEIIECVIKKSYNSMNVLIINEMADTRMEVISARM